MKKNLILVKKTFDKFHIDSIARDILCVSVKWKNWNFVPSYNSVLDVLSTLEFHLKLIMVYNESASSLSSVKK